MLGIWLLLPSFPSQQQMQHNKKKVVPRSPFFWVPLGDKKGSGMVSCPMFSACRPVVLTSSLTLVALSGGRRRRGLVECSMPMWGSGPGATTKIECSSFSSPHPARAAEGCTQQAPCPAHSPDLWWKRKPGEQDDSHKRRVCLYVEDSQIYFPA